MTWLALLPRWVKIGGGVLAVVIATAAGAIYWFNSTLERREREAREQERARIERASTVAIDTLESPAVKQLRRERDSLAGLVTQQLAPRTVQKSAAVRRSVAALSDSSRHRPDVATLAADADSLANVADSLAGAAVQVVTVTETITTIDSTALRATAHLLTIARDTIQQQKVELMKRPTWKTVGKAAVLGGIAVEVGRRVVTHFARRDR